MMSATADRALRRCLYVNRLERLFVADFDRIIQALMDLGAWDTRISLIFGQIFIHEGVSLA